MIGTIVRLLRPSPREVVRLARRETDPHSVSAFAPLHLGLVPSLAALLCIGVVGVLVAPIRVVLRLFGTRT